MNAYPASFSARQIAEILSRPEPPYSSGIAAAEQADFAGLLQHLRHEMLVFVGFQLRDVGHYFLVHELLGSLADQALVVAEIRRCKNVIGRRRGNQERAAAIQGLRHCG